MATSALPAVIAALLGLARQQLPGVQVADGHPGGTIELDNDLLIVGAGGVEMPSALFEQSIDDDLGCGRTETGRIYSEAFSGRGDIDLPGVRARVFALVAGVEEGLRADPTLGGLVISTELNSDAAAYWQGNTPDGSFASLPFWVKYRAYL